MRRKKRYFLPQPGDPAPVTCEVRHRVMFSEVDALAIGWHGHYPRLFELCHTELMRGIGLTYDIYRSHGVGAPIVQLHADYFQPLELDEVCTIRGELVWFDGARINVNYEIVKENGEVAGTGYTVQMLFNALDHSPFITQPPFFEKIWRKAFFHDAGQD